MSVGLFLSFVDGLHKGRCPSPRICFHLPYDEHVKIDHVSDLFSTGRILFVMPSGPAALSHGKCFSISLTSSLVGVLLSSGSGICESDGWGELSMCVTRSASDVTQGVSMLVQTFYSNMGFPLYVTLYPHFFVSGNIGAHL